jgi:hypothetical protein
MGWSHHKLTIQIPAAAAISPASPTALGIYAPKLAHIRITAHVVCR